MPRPSAPERAWRRTTLTLLASVVGGALAGAVVAWTIDAQQWEAVGRYLVVPSLSASQQGEGATSSTPGVTVIPVDRRPQSPLIPAPFLENRVSLTAGVYRRPAPGNASGLLTDDRLLAQAVVVTSDGWFAVPAEALEDIAPSSMLLWYEGAPLPVTSAVRDRFSGVVFLKTAQANSGAPAFARVTDVTPGLAVWVERRAHRFEPSGVLALSEPVGQLDGISSEQVARRGVVNGVAGAGDRGAPIWSANGALVGVVTALPGEPLQYLPASAWASSLSSLLTSGEIRHAALGVRSVELAWARFGERAPEDALPIRGAWLREDSRAPRRPAVTLGSAAAIAGLRAGDVIQAVERDMLDGSMDLAELLAAYRPDTHVMLTVLRDGETLDIPVTLKSIVTSEEL